MELPPHETPSPEIEFVLTLQNHVKALAEKMHPPQNGVERLNVITRSLESKELLHIYMQWLRQQYYDKRTGLLVVHDSLFDLHTAAMLYKCTNQDIQHTSSVVLEFLNRFYTPEIYSVTNEHLIELYQFTEENKGEYATLLVNSIYASFQTEYLVSTNIRDLLQLRYED